MMIHVGDCREIMPTLPADFADAIVTDPPYHLTEGKGTAKGFMGKEWDGGDIAFQPSTWSAALHVAKPGAFLAAFGGTRTFHRMACAIEDAGWEIRDTIMWVYGSGFPKSHNGLWGGTALKPAWEPIILARKPPAGTIAANHEAYGTGGLNIDGCRICWPDGVTPDIGTPGWGGPAKKLTVVPGQDDETIDRTPPSPLGRWPANIIHDGSDEVLAAFPDAPGQIADTSTNFQARKTQNTYGVMRRERAGEPSSDSENTGSVGFKMRPGARRTDSGSAARFFYCAKASRADRNAGLMRENADWQSRNGNHHPTVKPTDLMRYLCRLVTPARCDVLPAIVLDPFMGSGSTGRAAVLEGFAFIGIEIDPVYAAIAASRIDAAARESALPTQICLPLKEGGA